MIDTHCHLPLLAGKNQISNHEYHKLVTSYINRALNNNITTIINIGTTVQESIDCIELAHLFKECFAVIGIHPTEINHTWKNEYQQIEKLLKEKEKNKIVGIGECGIDLFHKKESLVIQKDAFKGQIELALKYDLALVIHSRNAPDETLEVLELYHKDIQHLVFHCFSYDESFAQQAYTWGYMLGIGGTITYPKNDILRRVIKNAHADAFVLETDAPFLPIQSMRGKQNAPEHIADIASFIATIREVTQDDIDHITTQNAKKLFKLKR